MAVVVELDVNVVKAPVDGVVAPTVTLFNADTVEPKAAEVAPKVIVEFVNPEFGNPVALVKTNAVGVPRLGVINVGDMLPTRTPVPVSSLMAENNDELEVNADAHELATVAIPLKFPSICDVFKPGLLTLPRNVGVKVESAETSLINKSSNNGKAESSFFISCQMSHS